MGGNPHDPLTTTNSPKELTMADANLKPRRAATNMSRTFPLRLKEIVRTNKASARAFPGCR